MPKKYIQQRMLDPIYLRSAYHKLIKVLFIVYIIAICILYKLFMYNRELNHNDYFIITTFGKLIEIFPVEILK